MPTTPGPDRTEMADALAAVSPDAPTLCEGWDARDLAIHLVLRDGRPDVLVGELAGKALPAVGRPAAKVRARLEAMPWEELVGEVRGGPPPWSPTRVPAIEAQVNGAEFYVHAQDVVRAQPGFVATDLLPLRDGQRERLWRALKLLPMRYGKSTVGVVRQVPSGESVAVRGGARSVTLRGQPEELLLHGFGRRSSALVEVLGDPDAVAAFEQAYPSGRSS